LPMPVPLVAPLVHRNSVIAVSDEQVPETSRR
jgi:hypothetical protein